MLDLNMYAGSDRFILFYFEPRSREVRWQDSRSSGSAGSVWPAPLQGIQDKAAANGITLGTETEPGDHVLLVDRIDEHAVFAYREQAQEFLARQSATAA